MEISHIIKFNLFLYIVDLSIFCLLTSCAELCNQRPVISASQQAPYHSPEHPSFLTIQPGVIHIVSRMERVFKILRAPGARREVECAVSTQIVQEKGFDVSVENINTYTVTTKDGVLDHWLDKVVEASGSEFIYFTTIIALLTWTFLGIPFGKSNTWQLTIDRKSVV